MADYVTSREFIDALVAADVIRSGDGIRRLVIDAQVDHLVAIHIERRVDSRILNVMQTLNGIQIREEDSDEVVVRKELGI